jgi:hypothetical protein
MYPKGNIAAPNSSSMEARPRSDPAIARSPETPCPPASRPDRAERRSAVRPCGRAAWASSNWLSAPGACGLTITAMVAAFGTISRSSPSRFASSELAKMKTPVALPPGRFRLATRPSSTGSAAAEKTIGRPALSVLLVLRGFGRLHDGPREGAMSHGRAEFPVKRPFFIDGKLIAPPRRNSGGQQAGWALPRPIVTDLLPC